MSLFLNGTVWKVWGLHNDRRLIQGQMNQAQIRILEIEQQIEQAKDPYFIERQARDKMDMVSEDDLVFVFPD
jgi:cell division protein FtsB